MFLCLHVGHSLILLGPKYTYITYFFLLHISTYARNELFTTFVRRFFLQFFFLFWVKNNSKWNKNCLLVFYHSIFSFWLSWDILCWLLFYRNEWEHVWSFCLQYFFSIVCLWLPRSFSICQIGFNCIISGFVFS